MSKAKKAVKRTEPSGPGLACRNCGCRHFPVVYTKPIPGGRIVRRRQCRNCGRRITTTEKKMGMPN